MTKFGPFAFLLCLLVEAASGFRPASYRLHYPFFSVPIRQNPPALRVAHLDTSQQSSIQRNLYLLPEDYNNRLWSYVYSIQKVRRNENNQTLLTRPARSLEGFLQSTNCTTPPSEPLIRALIQAFRAAGQAGDFRLITRLVKAAVHHAPALPPRIFGEAIHAMAETPANINKIKQIWNLAQQSTLTEPLGPFESNVYLQALRQHGKLGAAIHFLQDCPADAYTASLAFCILQESIHVHTYAQQWPLAMEWLDRMPMNNQALTAFLQLNEHVSRRIPQHNPYTVTRYVVDSIVDHFVPDVVTYSRLLSALSPRDAVKLLRDMEKQTSSLPLPNSYTYSAAITAAVRGHQPRLALSLLRMPSKYRHCRNTWVYNAALPACNDTQQALHLLERMEEDHTVHGLDTAPDTCTYNTILMIPDVGNSSFALIDEMKKKGIARDEITYRNAIRTGMDVLTLLDAALTDLGPTSPKALFNAALAKLATTGDLVHVAEVINKMRRTADVVGDADTSRHLLVALSQGGRSDVMGVCLKAMSGCQHAKKELFLSTQISIGGLFPPPDAKSYATAVSTCLGKDNLNDARNVLEEMKNHNISASEELREEVCRSYCRVARKAAEERDEYEVNHLRALTRARSGYEVARTLRNPPSSTLALVATTCSSLGLWKEARTMLQKIHKSMVNKLPPENGVKAVVGPGCDDTAAIIPSLHRKLLKDCASQGNVTAALWFVEDIQAFSGKLKNRQENLKLMNIPGLRSSAIDLSEEGMGMNAQGWKLLLIAASKSGHWRVCLSTLQFLRPYLESTNPIDSTESRGVINSKYRGIASALTYAVRCLETRSQYAWAVRIIDDWIDWTGRRPHIESVLSAMRVLAARGRSEEVKYVISRCSQQKSWSERHHPEQDDRASYNEILYIGGITALHNNGLYDDADEIFISAVSKGLLPLSLSKEEKEGETRFTLDLHGMSLAIAHSAVRMALQQELLLPTDEQRNLDITIVTGRGKNSARPMRPILRPEVQRMMLEEFYPPLNTLSVPGNMGAIRIPAEDIQAWANHQRQQKGLRMLAIAAALKDITSGDRLRESIAKSLTMRSSEEDRS